MARQRGNDLKVAETCNLLIQLTFDGHPKPYEYTPRSCVCRCHAPGDPIPHANVRSICDSSVMVWARPEKPISCARFVRERLIPESQIARVLWKQRSF